MAGCVLVAAGGTGGHLYPALSLLEALAALAPRIELLLVTTDAAHETALLRGYGRLPTLRVASLTLRPRESRAPWAQAAFGVRVLRAWYRAARLMEAWSPVVVFGFGSYASLPVVLAGRLAGRRILLHEQNVVPGQANRWLAPLADRVAVSCAPTLARWTGRTPRVLTGNPIRASIGVVTKVAARAALGLSPQRRTLLVLGGSRGARSINRLMAHVVERWSADERAAMQVLHLAGQHDAPLVTGAYLEAGVAHRVLPFCDQMAEAYAAADLALTRAGATTLAELAAAGRPAACIPYPHGDGHQRYNAQWWTAAGAGICFEERTLTVDDVARWLAETLRDEALVERMAANAARLAVPDAAARLAREALALAGWTEGASPRTAEPLHPPVGAAPTPRRGPRPLAVGPCSGSSRARRSRVEGPDGCHGLCPWGSTSRTATPVRP